MRRTLVWGLMVLGLMIASLPLGGCSSESPKPAGMMALSTVIREMIDTWLWASLPFATNSVAKGGSSALLAASSSLPFDVNAISSTRVVPPVGTTCLSASAGGGPVAAGAAWPRRLAGSDSGKAPLHHRHADA